MRKAQKKERGQAIVLIAVSFLALIAFTGLAIDGGRIYADRRDAQNASDAGSLAGGGEVSLALENANIDHLNFQCDNPTNSDETAVVAAVQSALAIAEQTAIESMETNGYNSTDFSVESKCFEGNSTFQHYIDITTTITKETTASFIQVVYDEPLINLVDATTEVIPRHPWAYGNAIVALNPSDSCDNASAGGIKFGGTGEVRITGGGAWSDGCLTTQGNCNVTIEGGPGISFVGGNFGTCPVMHPTPTSATEPLDPDSYLMSPPECAAADRIDSITVHNNQTLDLNPGYYDPNDPTAPANTAPAKLICVTDSGGNAIKMTGGTLIGHGVTIYMENGGDININGGDVHLSSPVEADEPTRAIPGVIIYAPPAEDPDDPSNNPDSEINIEGNHDSFYTGMIYGPSADIKITGEGDLGPTLNTQIIGYNVTLLGTAMININFNDSWVSSIPTSLNLKE